PHAYYTHVAWPLIELYSISGSESYRNAAEKHIRWVLSLRSANGWISNMGFSKEGDPFTHTVAYTYEGLLECTRYLTADLKAEVLEVVEKAMTKICESHLQLHSGNNGSVRLLLAFLGD